jgi:uncharacterized repeat protein (TIGR02543 family)
MAAKIFEVGDVLPATTQLRISWANGGSDEPTYPFSRYVDILKSDNDSFSFFINTGTWLLLGYYDTDYGIYDYDSMEDFVYPCTSRKGDHPYMDIDTSEWSLEKRTISTFVNDDPTSFTYNLTWQDMNAPQGYTISFNSNGGTTFPDIEDATELPTPLPIPTKSGYTFVAWYYESNFQTRAKAGDTIESNVTLYAKWHNLGSLFAEIADAIRSKDGTSEKIRDVDFPDRIRALND